MRVVAGSLRGRRIDAPDSSATRPTTDKVREAVFNALGSIGEPEGSRVVDLFAGSGAMGIEAISRGAVHCTFVERDRKALASLRSNIEHLGISDRCAVVDGDAAQWATRVGDVDLMIIDPPYGFDTWGDLLSGVSAALVVVESDTDPGDVAGWQTVRSKRYGRTHVTFLRPATPGDGTVGEQ